MYCQITHLLHSLTLFILPVGCLQRRAVIQQEFQVPAVTAYIFFYKEKNCYNMLHSWHQQVNLKAEFKSACRLKTPLLGKSRLDSPIYIYRERIWPDQNVLISADAQVLVPKSHVPQKHITVKSHRPRRTQNQLL